MTVQLLVQLICQQPHFQLFPGDLSHVSEMIQKTSGFIKASMSEIQGLLKASPIVFKDLKVNEQVAQLATIFHQGASIKFGDTIIYDARRQETKLETVTRN